MAKVFDLAELPAPTSLSIPRNVWFPVPSRLPSLLRPVNYNNETVYWRGGEATSDDSSDKQFSAVRNGIVFIPGRGESYVYVDDAQGSGKFKWIKEEYPDLTLALISFLAAGGTLPIGGTGGAADTRNADADADFAAALIGLVTNARLSGFNGANWAQILVRGALANQSYALNRLLVDSVLRADDGVDWASAKISRGDTQRSGAVADFLLTRAVMTGLDVVNTTTAPVEGVPIISGVNNIGMAVKQARAAAYYASRLGRKFAVTDEGAGVAITNGFTATAPNLLIQCGATNEYIIEALRIGLPVVGTAPIKVRFILDPDGRYSSGGTSRTPGNKNGGNATAATGAQHRDGAITATATDADEREIWSGVIENVAGKEHEIPQLDGLIIPASGTLLGYVYGGAAAGSFSYTADLEDANVQ